jgi:predicted nucleic acid-binding protein
MDQPTYPQTQNGWKATVPERPILLDASTLVAYLNRREAFHKWTVSTADGLSTPFITCESVISEASFLLQRAGVSLKNLFAMMDRKSIHIAFDLQSEFTSVATLMREYDNLPMSVADGCLVRLAELHDGASVFTLDKHFRIYRKNGRQKIPVIMPDEIR